jgi:glycosyltransferase involved in cell wall biosynthesis
MRVAVCAPQVPFAHGGAEFVAERLTEELRARGYEADLVTIPFKWYPGTRVLTQSLLWRLLDLDEVDGRPVDLVIATKFPSYVIRHPNKVVWLVHQFRQAYELDRTELGQFGEDAEERATRRAIHRLDRETLGEASKLFAISSNVAGRLKRSIGLDAEVLLPPPQELSYRCEDYGDFVLSVNRLDRAKRIDLLLEAARQRGFRVVVAGDGPDRGRLEGLANGSVTFEGRVGEDRLAELYGRCRAVYYAPYDEDYGIVPYEAFMASKPVITTVDAGGPLDVVADRRTGLVCEPRADSIADACAYLLGHDDDARTWGNAGRAVAEQLSWAETVDRLLAAA